MRTVRASNGLTFLDIYPKNFTPGHMRLPQVAKFSQNALLYLQKLKSALI